jgi:hypothetical protein
MAAIIRQALHEKFGRDGVLHRPCRRHFPAIAADVPLELVPVTPSS